MNLEKLVPLIHATPAKGVVIPTGGGTRVFPMLLELGGGSNTLLDGQVPYKEFMTDEILGGKPDKYVSELTARQLAMAAYQKALKIRSKDAVSYPNDTEDYPIFGVACTVSLQKTPKEREGRKHYIYAALQTGKKTVSLSVELDPAVIGPFLVGGQDAFSIRVFEEVFTASLLINLIAEACGLKERLDLTQNVTVVRHESNLENDASGRYLEMLLDGTIDALIYHPEQGFWIPVEEMHKKQFILPGSFRPAHPGHFEMAEYVDQKYGYPTHKCFFELSIRNAAKPPLDFISLEERLKTTGDRSVWITNAPTFKDKARIFPCATFIVGYDTAIRIIDPKYADINEVIQAFIDYNVTFTVFGRLVDGKYHYELDYFPQWFRSIAFQVDYVLPSSAVSSTSIRTAERTVGNAVEDQSAGLEDRTPADQGNQKADQK